MPPDPEITINLACEADTIDLGRRLGALAGPGDVIALSGDLGAGKTCVARGIIREALEDGAIDVTSPTFTLVQTYEAAEFDIWHFDLYRLETAGEIWALGLEDALDSGLCVIEWPERAASALPDDTLKLHLETTETGRRACFFTPSNWKGRLDTLK